MLKRCLLLLSLCFTTAVFADTPDKVVNDVMHQYMQQNDVPGAAVIVYVDGKPYSYYFGVADKATKKPISKDTIFELGSITKLMTTLLLAQEVDFAKIKLKDPITKYVPTLPASFSGISMRSLATHTGGFSLYAPDNVVTRNDWEKFAAAWKPDHAADTNYEYSNIGIGLIGYALESVTHQNYNQLYRAKILAPLGMQPIGFTVPKKLEGFYAIGYGDNGTVAPRITDGLFPAAGTMKASASDMGKFLSAAIGLPQTPESIFYPLRMTQMAYLEVGDFGQGLAWQIHDTSPENIKPLLAGTDLLEVKHAYPVTEVFKDPVFNGNYFIDKSGATDGFRTYIAVIPNKKTGIVILTNRRVLGKPVVVAGREILFKLNGMK